MIQVMKEVHASHGVAGLFKGVIPRVLLGMWQTLFMVTGFISNLMKSLSVSLGAKLVKDMLA